MLDRAAGVRGAVEAFNGGDYGAFAEIFSEDLVLFADPQVASRSEYRGREGVAEWIAEARSRWSDVRFAALAVEPVGETVLVELGVVGETPDGGGAWRLYVVLHWDGDRVHLLRSYPTRDAALADARCRT
jgi:ketosteroid isomerase-like protein